MANWNLRWYVSAVLCTASLLMGAEAAAEEGTKGVVLYEDSSPAMGAVVYALDRGHPLAVTNNKIMMAEHIPRAIMGVNILMYAVSH